MSVRGEPLMNFGVRNSLLQRSPEGPKYLSGDIRETTHSLDRS